MISYAQNAEDVVLARALPGDTGFYVDVGAASPDASSVTRHFYEKGWSGINIDPRPDAADLLRERRPRDRNLQMAVGAADGTIRLYEVEQDLDLSTIDESDLDYLTAKGYTYRIRSVPVRTLDSVLAAAGVEQIDFLKVDAEGSEAAVLGGIDLARWRPRVIVVEAVKPWGRDRTDGGWRHLVETRGYREALFDGINLFFVAEEHPDVMARMQPASPLDEYVTAEAVAMQRELDWHRSRLPAPEQAPVPARGAPLPPTARLAVIGTPHSGQDWLAPALARSLDARVIAVDHPAEVAWERLPARFVLDLAWPRTAALEDRLRRCGARVLSPARHPLAALRDACDRSAQGSLPPGAATDFVQWMDSDRARWLLAITAGWWRRPATVRVRWEDLVASPEATWHALLRDLRLPEVPVPAPVPDAGGPAAAEGELERFSDTHPAVLGELGYAAA